MKFENIMKYVVQSGSILAASAGAIVISNMIAFGFPIDPLLVLLAFLLTFSSYHINRIAEIEQDIISNPERTRFIQQHRLLDKLALVSLAVVILVAITRNVQTLVFALIPPICVILYSYQTLPWIKRFKDIIFVKNIFVAGAWATLMFLTVAFFSSSFTNGVFAMAIFFFLRFFINTVVFDIRDLIGDKIHQIKTLPVHFGESTTRNLLLFVNTIAGIFLFFAVEIGWLPYFAHILNLMTFYGYSYIIMATDEKIDKHALCDIIVDGEFLLWPILLFIGRLFMN